MTAIVSDKSNSQLIHLQAAFSMALGKFYGESMLHDLTEQQLKEWDEVFKSNNPDAECEVTKRWAAKADIEQRFTGAFLSDALIARAYTIDRDGNEKRCLLPKEFWGKSPNSSFSASGFHAFWHGTVNDSTRLDTIQDFSKIVGWSVGVEKETLEKWMNISSSRVVTSQTEKDTVEEARNISAQFQSETHWNVIQTLGWIMQRNQEFVVNASNANTDFGTRWEEFSTPSGVRLVEVTNDRPGLIRLHIGCVGLGVDIEQKPLFYFSEAARQLISKLRAGDLTGDGRRNDVGDLNKMIEKDWHEVSFYEDNSGKIYVASKDHVPAIGRTLWYDVTFKKEAVLKYWPQYDSEWLNTYYSKFHTNGRIKAHRLAALIVQIEHVGNISSPEAKSFKDDLSNLHTPVGLVFSKIRDGIESCDIDILSKGQDIEHHIVNIWQAMDWLRPHITPHFPIHPPFDFYVKSLGTPSLSDSHTFAGGSTWVDLEYDEKLKSITKNSTPEECAWKNKQERNRLLRKEYNALAEKKISGAAKSEVIFNKYKSELAKQVHGGRVINTASAVYRICAARN